jgi:glutamate/aspartate transport system substrate-binding protein
MNPMQKTLLGVCALLLTLAGSVHAQEAEGGGTLEKIRKSGVIVLGYRNTSIPLSYVDATRAPIGYAKELCDKVVEAIRTRFELPDLQIKYHLVESSNRLRLLQEQVIDMECGSTTNTLERQKEADFSVSYFISNVRMAARRDSRIRGFDDLRGKAIVTTQGTTSEALLEQDARLASGGIRLLYGKTHAQSFLMIRDGRAAAFVMDDILLTSLIANAKDPNAYEIVGPVLRVEPYAIMLRKGDALKKIADDTLTNLMRSGEAARLYDRWFMNPIPPRDINLRLPMSDALKEAFAQPTDEGVE